MSHILPDIKGMKYMSRISNIFKQGKALITYIMAGDPDINATYNYVLKLEKAGANIIELGIPFSDPSADGSVIVGSGVRSLKHNYHTDDYFSLIAKIRKTSSIPLVIMAYANTIFCYGIEKFFEKFKSGGGDGIIIPDVSFEESGEFVPFAQKYGIDYIPLVTPASNGRIEKIIKDASGFVYCVSSYGVTGTREKFTQDFKKLYGQITLPKAVGFGISSIEQIKEMKIFFDGVIIGSKIVKYIENGQIKQMLDFVSSASKVLHNF